MVKTSPFHHVGTFLILAAAVLLLVTTITAPVVKDISMLKVTLTNSSDIRHSSVTFGTFGHCVLDVAPAATDQDWCTGRTVGYSPLKIMEVIDNAQYSSSNVKATNVLTRIQILHPITCAIAFIAFLLSLGAGVIGSVMSALVASFAWIITLFVLITDFVCWGIVKDRVNKDGSGSLAKFGPGMWTELAALIVLFFGATVVLCSCCGARRTTRGTNNSGTNNSGTGTGTGKGRRFWQRKY